jgi:hypothetical protein
VTGPVAPERRPARERSPLVVVVVEPRLSPRPSLEVEVEVAARVAQAARRRVGRPVLARRSAVVPVVPALRRLTPGTPVTRQAVAAPGRTPLVRLTGVVVTAPRVPRSSIGSLRHRY